MEDLFNNGHTYPSSAEITLIENAGSLIIYKFGLTFKLSFDFPNN